MVALVLAAAIKTVLFVSLVLFLGAGFFARFIGPELRRNTTKHRLYWSMSIGAVLLLISSVLILGQTAYQLFGGLYPDLLWDYLIYTRQGVSTLGRLALVVLILALGLGRRLAPGLDRYLFILLGLGLIVSISRVSHGGTLGTLPLLADVLHLLAATVWAGALLYLAWLPIWSQAEPLEVALKRVSQTGLLAVMALLFTGIYASLLHLYGFSALTETPYGWALASKIVLVLVILFIAALNRFVLVANLGQAETIPLLRRLVRIESLLLVAVLAATGILTSLEPANAEDHALHGQLGSLDGTHEGHEEDLLNPSAPMSARLGTDPETGFALLIITLQAEGQPLTDATVNIITDQSQADGSAVMVETENRNDGRYTTTDFEVPIFGEWVLSVEVSYPDGQRVIEEIPVE